MRFLFRRIFSYAIDFVIFSLLIGLFTFSINVFYADPAMQDKVLFMFVCALIVSLGLTTYIPVQNKGQTIGQKIMKIQIVNKSGKPRTYLQSFLREGVAKISVAPLFVVFSVIYYFVQVIMTRNFENELAIDVLCKTEAVDLTVEKSRSEKRRAAKKLK